jgi:hypothetical protein
VRPASDRLPGHALALSLHKVWEVIQHQKDLNLPAHKVLLPFSTAILGRQPSCFMSHC